MKNELEKNKKKSENNRNSRKIEIITKIEM